MLTKITKPFPAILNSLISLKILLIDYIVYRIEREYRKAFISAIVKKLFRATEKLISQYSIDIYTIKGLI